MNLISRTTVLIKFDTSKMLFNWCVVVLLVVPGILIVENFDGKKAKEIAEDVKQSIEQLAKKTRTKFSSIVDDLISEFHATVANKPSSSFIGAFDRSFADSQKRISARLEEFDDTELRMVDTVLKTALLLATSQTSNIHQRGKI